MGRKSTERADMKIETLFAVLMVLVVGMGGILLWRVALLEKSLGEKSGSANSVVPQSTANTTSSQAEGSAAAPRIETGALDGVVSKVSGDALVLISISGVERNFKLTDTTKIIARTPSRSASSEESVTEKAAAVGDIKPGQNASVEFSVVNGASTATKIIIIAI
jgi:hypothetical protein